MTAQPCPICTAQDEDILLQTPKLRVIAVHNDSGSPAFCRVIWRKHIAEMTDLFGSGTRRIDGNGVQSRSRYAPSVSTCQD